MPVPKRRKSKSRRDMRRATHKLSAPTSLNPCPRCGSPKLPHRVCLHCGHYKGKEVVPME